MGDKVCSSNGAPCCLAVKSCVCLCTCHWCLLLSKLTHKLTHQLVACAHNLLAVCVRGRCATA